MATKPSSVQAADFQDLFRRQFGSSVTFSKSVIAATCGFTLLVVSLLCSKVEMERIYASPIVAVMQNLLANWDWSAIEIPRDYMGTLNSFPIPQIPITIRVSGSIPEPASIVNQHARLESFSQSLTRRFDESLKESVASITASAIEMPECIVAANRVEMKVAQAHAQHVVAPMANTENSGRSFEIEPNPFSGINRLAVLAEHGTPTVVRASGPNLTRSQCGVVGGNRTITINVLVEPEDWVHELGRHNGGHSLFCLATLGSLPSAATLANIGS